MVQAQSGVPTTLSLEQPAYVNGPVWLRVQAQHPPPYGDVRYPVGIAPADFGCQDVEVRRDGKMIPRIPLPPSANSSGGGLMCGSIGLPGHEMPHQGRLPLHLQYRFDKPGVYEVRYTRWPAMPRSPAMAPLTQTAWTQIEIQPIQPLRPGPPPQDPGEALSDYLPGILGFPDDAHLRLLTDYLYHPSDTVRRYASLGLDYWPAEQIDRHLTELLHTRGPSDVLVERTYRSPGAVDLILPHLRSTDPVLVRGATIGVTRLLFSEPPLLSAEVRARTEDALISAAASVLRVGDSQTGIDCAAALGGVHDPRSRTLLWTFVDRDVVTEESLIAITWFKNLADLPRLASLLEGPAHGDPMQTTYASIPYAIHNGYGDAALPVLESAIAKSGYVFVRTACARELVMAGQKSGFAFIAQAIQEKKFYRDEMVRFLQERFPELRGADDGKILEFLQSR
jgi:hypothetical protein